MADEQPICPVCRTRMQPTWVKEIRAFGGDVVRRIPQDPQCPNDCINQVEPAVYNEAVRKLEQEQQG